MHMEQVTSQYVKQKKLNVTTNKKNTNMINFDDITNENMKKHNPRWLQIPDYQ